MKGKIFLQMFLFISLIKVHCESKENANSKKFVPYFRRQVEEMEDNTLSETTEKDDPRGNLVSFLVNNVKEIFDDIVENTETRGPETTLKPTVITVANITPPITNSLNTVSTTITISSTEVSVAATTPTTTTSNVTLMSPNRTTSMSSTRTAPMPTTSTDVIHENITLTTLLDDKRTRQSELTKKKSIAKSDRLDHDIHMLTSSGAHIEDNSTDQFMEHDDPRRSCISCNNVAVEDCNDPKNKL